MEQTMQALRLSRTQFPMALALIVSAFTCPLYPGSASAQTCNPVQVQKLLASDADAEDRFGDSGTLRVDGNRLVVGARYHIENGLTTGAAYVFRREASGWVEEQKLVSSDADEGDKFGGWNAMSGDTIISGTSGDADNGPDSGSAYVFKRTGNVWTQTQKLLPNDGRESDQFGRMVAMEGNTAVIGAWNSDGIVPNAGAVYIFEYDGNAWVQTQKLFASDGLSNATFGSWMDISGDTLIVGDSRGTTTSGFTGAAYVFRKIAGVWTEVQKLEPSAGTEGGIFGHSVDISGNRAVIGSAYSDDYAGAAYVFRFDGSHWVEEQRLTASDAEAMDLFGYSDISGDTVVVGARWDDEHGDHAGAVYVFRYDGLQWIEEQKIVSEDIAEGDSFGWSLAIWQDTLLVGARNDDDFGNGTGSAYVFDLGCIDDCPADTNHDGTLSPADFTAWIAALNAASPECDQNADNACTPADFTAWIANYNAGCP